MTPSSPRHPVGGESVVDDELGAGRRITAEQASLERLGLDRVDIAFLHDPPTEQLDLAATDGYRALRHLRDAGTVRDDRRRVGPGRADRRSRHGTRDGLHLARKPVHTARPVRAWPAAAAVRQARNGGDRRRRFNSGILAGPDGPFGYLPAGPEVRARVEQITRHCDRFGVSLRAAAQQFPLAHPAVAGIVLGMRSAAELRDKLQVLDVEIPARLWTALQRDGLLPHDAPTPEPD